MAKIPYKYIGVSELYKYVYLYKYENNIKWRCHVLKFSKFYDTEKEAAICVDMQFIQIGKNPVNVLKKCGGEK